MKKSFHATGEHRSLLASKIICSLFLCCIGITQLYADNTISGGTNIKVLPGTSTVSSRDLVLNPGAKFVNGGIVILKKDLHNECSMPTLTGPGLVKLDGDYMQIISGSNCIQNLIINNESGINLGGITKVEGTLFLENGTLNLGDYNLVLGPFATISGEPSNTKMINATGTGELRKQFPQNFAGNFTFPVGDQTEIPDYSPVTLTFLEGTFLNDNYIGVTLKNSKYPDSIITDNYLKRYWNFSTGGTSGLKFDVVLKYVPSDVVGDENQIYCLKIDENQILTYNPADPVNHVLKADSTTSFSSFTGGSSGVMLSGPTNVCAGSSGNIYTTNAGKQNYSWVISQGGIINGGGTSSDNFVSITWNSTGSQTVSVIYSGISNPAALNVTVNPRPSPTINGQSIVCQGSSGRTYSTETGMSGYQWSVSEGGTITAGAGTSQISVVWNVPGEQYVAVNYANGFGCTALSSTFFPVTVNPILPVSLSIQESANQVCEGSSVTFTATPINGGTNPSYQWYRNSQPVGSNNPVYSCIPEDGDVIKAVLTSSEICQSGPATSNTIAMVVKPILTVSVMIQENANQVCEGTTVIFNASPVNGGTNPTYQWYKNSAPVGANSPLFSYIPVNGDIIKVVLTSSEICQSGQATSNEVTMIVNPLLPVSVTIQPGANGICEGTPVTFNANSVNGGSNPSYQWYQNSIPVGTNSPVYTYVPLNGDIIKVVLTSSEICQSGPATSNSVTMVVNPSLPVSITIQASSTQVCEGAGITFNATPVNGGTNPSFQWYKNSVPVGTNSPVYTYIPQNGDAVKVVLTSSEICQSGPATSNEVIIAVNPLPVPTITGLATVCAGTQNVIYKTEADMNGYTWTVSPGGIINSGGGTSTIYVTWSTAGEHLVKVNYANSFNCTASSATEYNVHVNALPVPSMTGEVNVCMGKTEIYTTEPGMTGYVWTVSQGGTINEGTGTNTVSVKWNALGTNYLKVNYTNPDGCSAVFPTTKIIYVHELPDPSLSGPAKTCLNTITTFMTDPGNYDYNWIISPGGIILTGTSSNSNVVNVKWTLPGSHWISVNYTNGYGCMAASATSKDLQVTGPTIVGAAEVCKFSIEDYSTEPGMGNSYVWAVNGGIKISGGGPSNNTIQIKWLAVGNRYVKVTYTDDGCTATTVFPVIVNNSSPSLTGPSTSCKFSLSEYITEPGMLNYNWTVSSGGTIEGSDSTSEVTIKWISGGDQTVSVDYDSPFGCAITPTTIHVNIYENPVPSLNGPAGPFCMDNSLLLYTTDPNQLNYTWEISSGTKIISGGGPNDNSVKVMWTGEGNQWIAVNYTSKHYCTAPQPSVINVFVNPVPEPTISGPTSVDINSEATYETESGMTNYQWKVIDGGIIVAGGGPNDDFMTVHWTGEGTQMISIGYANEHGCFAQQPTYLYVDVHQPIKLPSTNTSFDNNQGNSNSRRITAPEFIVYPVPNYGRFTISIDSPDKKDYSIQIFNSLGAEIYLQNNIRVEGNFKQIIDISHVAEGIYTVIVNNGDTQASKRIHIRK